MVERFELQAERAGSDLRLSACAVSGRWDRTRIDQIVTNLVGNAIKYGNGQPVDVSVEERDGRAVLAVRDRGVGIPPESHMRIFERFERVTGASVASGLGLGRGLWIAKRMVEAHGGDIGVESAPGSGSTFTVTLPRSVA